MLLRSRLLPLIPPPPPPPLLSHHSPPFHLKPPNVHANALSRSSSSSPSLDNTPLFIPPGVSREDDITPNMILPGSNIVVGPYAGHSHIKQVEFVKSSPRARDCPRDGRPEFAILGRSNVGKSSLINSLVRRKEFALTSKKPGKTQLINHFLVNRSWYIVDLPGYGIFTFEPNTKTLVLGLHFPRDKISIQETRIHMPYKSLLGQGEMVLCRFLEYGFANAPESTRTDWASFTKGYFLNRDTLVAVLLLVDASIPPQKIDLDCANWLGRNNIGMTFVFTKCDKVKGGKGTRPDENVKHFQDLISKYYQEPPPWIMTSSATGLGRDELLLHMSQLRNYWDN